MYSNKKVSVFGALSPGYTSYLSEVKDLEWFISYVLSYGSYMLVLEPAWVKEKVVKEIKKMQEIYEEKRES